MGKTAKIMEKSEKNLLHVYNRFPVAFDYGKGVYLYDVEGNKYLDFASGIGVNAFGYGDKEFEKELKDQVKSLTHISNLFYTKPLADAAALFNEISGMDKVFFTNSGAEAIDGALKTAKKYAYLKRQKAGKDTSAPEEIIAMNSSFHGRTVGSLSVTGNDHYREPFYPLMDGVKFADFNDFASVQSLVTENTCAIIMETIQGEGGIIPADKDFLLNVRKLCDEKDILLIVDEIQCGMGRSGKFFAFEKYGIQPDILTSAKALGAGVPIGAFGVNKKVAENSLVPGDHGSTFGGNPLAARAAVTSISIMKERKLPQHVEELTPYFEKKLDEIADSSSNVIERRGMGFMQGLVLKDSVKAGGVVNKLLMKGLVTLSAEHNVLRLLPPLVIEKKDIDKACKLIAKVIK